MSETATGELSPRDITFSCGKMPKLLDIITVPLQRASARTYQSENHLISGDSWVLSGTWEGSRTGELCDEADRLWINGYHSQSGLNDRMPVEQAEKSLSSSLLFIRPADLMIMVEKDPKGLNKVRAKFSFKGETYRLTVTDPAIEAVFLPKTVRALSGGLPATLYDGEYK
ncbi:MAG: hypothetical protein M0C28_05060 [Candidatus Moduliflexus flocculans]|nr:hypothetical protein [Candidatus Moduliflexus flocculans]